MAQQINMPEALPSVPGFSEQQVHDLINIVHSVMQQYFAPPNQLTPASTPPSSTPPTSSAPPAPQETQKEEDQQPLYQATVKDITESTTESTTKSIISAIPRLCTVRSSGDSATCLSLNTLLGYTLSDYIEQSKDIEAIGQGWKNGSLPTGVQSRDTHQGYSV